LASEMGMVARGCVRERFRHVPGAGSSFRLMASGLFIMVYGFVDYRLWFMVYGL